MYSRNTYGDILTLSASGWTYDNTFVLFDYETESLWYHLEGTVGLTCISGFYADRILQEYSSSLGRWIYWLEQHPLSWFLKDTLSY